MINVSELKKYNQHVIPIIESAYENFTPTEKNIAEFFLQRQAPEDLSASHIANLLHVSESSLSRFSKKCGFSGYREFSYLYKQSMQRDQTDDKNTELTHLVIDTYQDLLSKSFSMVDVEKIKRICQMIKQASIIYAYGVGNSSNCADEFKLRFMRFGRKIISESNHHTMRIQSTSMTKTDLVIGISISGKTREVIESLKKAHENGAGTILITSNNDNYFHKFCDEVFLVAVKKSLDEGRFISPQFPVLIMIDLLFAYYLNNSADNAIYQQTITDFKESQIDYLEDEWWQLYKNLIGSL